MLVIIKWFSLITRIMIISITENHNSSNYKVVYTASYYSTDYNIVLVMIV